MNNAPKQTAQIRVILVDDHTLVRETFKHILNDQAGIKVVGTAAGRKDCFALIAKEEPALVLLDICLGHDNGLEMLRQLKTTHSQLKCLILTGFIEDDYILEAIQSHTDGYLLKTCSIPTLINAIRQVATGHKFWDESILRRLSDIKSKKSHAHNEEKIDFLSAGEKEISRLVAEGLTNREIGKKVNLAEKTIRNRISLIMDKLHVPRRSKLAALYADNLARKRVST